MESLAVGLFSGEVKRGFFAGMLILLHCVSLSYSQESVPAVPAAHYGSWKSSRIGGGGYILDLVPTSDPKIYYLHTDVGGFYRSDDGGNHWRMLHGNLPATVGNQQPRGLVVDPRDPENVLVATGSHWEANPEGIYRSIDGGKTFEQTLKAPFAGNGNTRMWGNILTVDPKNPDVVLAASMKEGVYRSKDFGKTWENVGLKGLNPTDVDFDRIRPGRVLLCAQPYNSFFEGNAAAQLAGGFFLSEDGGVTWKELAEISPSPYEVMQTSDAFNSMWVGVFPFSKVKFSVDGGQSWADYGEGLPKLSASEQSTKEKALPSLQPIAATTFTAMASGPDFLLLGAGDGKLYRRNINEPAWTSIVAEAKAPDYWYGNPGNRSGWVHFGKAVSTLRVDPHDPKRWWLGDWYMLWQSVNGGREWNYSGDGIEVTVVHNITQIPDDPGHVHLGMADNGYFYSRDGGATFKQNWRVITNNIKDIAVAQKDPARTYAIGPMESGPWQSNQLFVSDDRGATWRKTAMTGLRAADSRRLNSLALDPLNKDRVYVALAGDPKTGGGVFVSEDAGETWKSISEGLPDTGIFQAEIWHVGRELAASQDGSMVAISNYKSRVFHRPSHSNQWVEAPVKFGKLNSVEADPFVPGRYLIASPTSGIYESTDGGVAWSKLSLETPCYHLAFDKAVPGRIAVGTSDGVAISLDSGKTWKVLDQALPNRIANAVAFAGDRVLAGTAGSGTFWMPLNEKGGKPVAATRFQEATLTPDKELLKNGDMDGSDPQILKDWAIRWKSVPDAKLQTNRESYVSKPASLELNLPTDGIAVMEQVLPEKIQDKRIRVKGKLKVEGNFTEVFVAIQSLDQAGTQISWVNILDGSNQAFDWKSFEKTIKLPSNCVRASLVIHVNGQGKVMLDDASVLQTER